MADGYLAPPALATLRALTARLVPGPPEDPDPGALEAHAAEAIDAWLGAFAAEPPRLHAGGPFSDRAGAAGNDFARFVAPDRLAELGWRIRLEGSRGQPEREFAGPVTGLQEIYTTGLAALDDAARAHGAPDFAGATVAQQDAVLAGAGTEGELAQFLATALAHTLDAVYGPPEYGGNHELVGWKATHWRGDVQPRGFTAAEVSEPDPSLTPGAGRPGDAAERVRSGLAPDAGWRS